MVDYSGAIALPNSNHFNGRDGLQPRWIILHSTAGGVSAQNIAAYFASTQGGTNPVSSHYVIGIDGSIVQCVSEENAAYANGGFSPGHDAWWDTSINPNFTTISIEHCKPSTNNQDQLTEAQVKASFALVKDICTRWNIPARLADSAGGVTGHFSIDPVNRAECPGLYPWSDLWAYLKGAKKVLDLTDSVVAQFFVDDGQGNWKCKKNGAVLLGANLTFYRSNGGPALLGLPLQGEIYLSEYPHTAIVPCERSILVYDPARSIDNPPLQGDVYLLHINSSIAEKIMNVQPVQGSTVVPPSNDELVTGLQTQVNALNGKIEAIAAILKQ
jgi:N-acetyl-anhydromuramyl-L-alanine amidase AmpD